MRNLPISLVIPVRNEGGLLNELFDSLNALSSKPAEVIFVDTGSDDGSVRLIERWMVDSDCFGFKSHIHVQKGAYPGAARNVGVKAASQPWIAFLDVGIKPRANWLEELWFCREEHNAEAVYGVCHFGSDHPMGRMLCAVSYGVGRVAPVLPASLFRRELFARLGGFSEGLRSGEDVLWRRRLEQADIALPTCKAAVVEYRHFPNGLVKALRKWFVYEQSAAAAGVGGGLRAILLGSILILYPALLFAWQHIWPALIIYLGMRGVIDPWRRCGGVWWSSPWQIVAMPIVVACLDIASAMGRLTAILGISKFRRER